MSGSLQPAQARRTVVYRPARYPGFTAWTTAFDYGGGRIGLSFSETITAPNPRYTPPKLEESEVIGAPVSYGSVFCGDPKQSSYRVYLASDDCGRTFYETGRCPLEDGSFCNVGFEDGRILGLEVPPVHKTEGGILVRESRDGGATWVPVTHLFPGTAPYLWRVRRLRSGAIVVLACFYGTPWGEGRERGTRNTMLPGESYQNKIQTFFLTSKDGVHYSEPHYVLPGTGAHEYDFAELEDGSLLFIAGDVQGTPVARQQVWPTPHGWVNGTLYGIGRGAPPDAAANPQGGYVPESFVALPGGLLVGSRRNKPYSVSNDLGANWTPLEGLPTSLYQPFFLLMPDGTLANFGHFGGDQGFGQEEMWIGADLFRIEGEMPQSTALSLERELAPDGSHYENRFSCVLRAGGRPLPGQTVTFRFAPQWAEDGSINTQPQNESPIQLQACTDEQGRAQAHAAAYDNIGDIHFSYRVDVIYTPGSGDPYAPCEGPTICCMALRPWRGRRYPYDAYFAEGKLFLSPAFLQAYPRLPELLAPLCGGESSMLPAGLLPEGAAERLTASGVLRRESGELHWIHSVHARCPLDGVLPMAGGDEYC